VWLLRLRLRYLDAIMDFLADTCVAGQTLLRLVSRGNAIVAELMRLSDNLPDVFLAGAPTKENPNPYHEIMFDFRYLKSAEYFEEKIDKNAVRPQGASIGGGWLDADALLAGVVGA